jgi:oxygen-independent coproporphyrinogen-3 oxidase
MTEPTPRFAPEEIAELLRKYDRPGPRYTSYPTAPVWTGQWGPDALAARLDALGTKLAAGEDRPLSLYFHIPFCEERCLYCGCNVVISRRKEIAAPYLERLKKEVDLYVERVGTGRRVVQMHLGGGTPTYFTPGQLTELMDHVRSRFSLEPLHEEISIETDPCVTTREHLVALREAGFTRISMGLQDLEPKVQETVHRVQPEELTDRYYGWCRELGFTSVNIDLIYGLPYQSEETFRHTVDRVLRWRPDRVAVFNYAHVPWIKKHQKLLPEDELPGPAVKLAIITNTFAQFREAGYDAIGLDHFALPEDELSIARRRENLRRNFMGYSTLPETDILAFGVSSISEVQGAYSQNEVHLARWSKAVDAGTLPAHKGVVLSEDDRIRREVIMGIMNNLALDYAPIEERFGIVFTEYFAESLAKLSGQVEDGLVELLPHRLQVTPKGQLLVRNTAMAFDAYLKDPRDEAGSPRFSRTV